MYRRLAAGSLSDSETERAVFLNAAKLQKKLLPNHWTSFVSLKNKF